MGWRQHIFVANYTRIKLIYEKQESNIIHYTISMKNGGNDQDIMSRLMASPMQVFPFEQKFVN